MNPITAYLQTLQADLQFGDTTEHTHRPALKTAVEALGDNLRATNEPAHVACGAPDFAVSRRTGHGSLTIGYIETKDIGVPLQQAQGSEQLARYRKGLHNLILTDYLEFRWYVDGELRQTARLAEVDPYSKLRKLPDGPESVTSLLKDFLAHQPVNINTPKDLAERMARLTHMIRDTIVEAFEAGQASALIQNWRKAFADILIADLNQPEKVNQFADMFAQTLAYGLFSARVMDKSPGFDLWEAQHLIPKTNPFLRDFFSKITGTYLEEEAFAPYVYDLVGLLAHTDMAGVLADFGKRTRQEDPVVHFYETFLAAYDPRLRESRGVYYTPAPVVSFIVRSVDALLKSRFGCPEGLADTSMVTVPNNDPGKTVRGKNQMRKTDEAHRVLVLDPATGTGTFLYAVIDHIRNRFMQGNNAGMWPGYVRQHLLPRLFGFELLMAPYAVAHFKLALQLAGIDLPEAQRGQWAYDFASDERIQVYLTNTLEEPHEQTGLPLFTQFLADETQQANRVKQDLPIMVIMGNPPYSGHSSNKGEWIDGLLKGKLPDGTRVTSYYEVDGKPLGEKNPKWLQDDYVKFIRWGQWRIEQSGTGVLAFISNNGYLDNPTFRGMRQSLMETFDEIYILNLHGNAKKKETAPDGSKDENVFDIQQGVAIGIFIRNGDQKNNGEIKYLDMWGNRNWKYQQLFESDLATIVWNKIAPSKPYYLFTLQDEALWFEYKKLYRVNEVFPVNVLGFQTHRDNYSIDFSYEALYGRIEELKFNNLSNELYREKYNLSDNRDWKFDIAREKIRRKSDWELPLLKCLYRPFDIRYCYFSEIAMDYPRVELQEHVAGKQNLCLGIGRQGLAVNDPEWALVTVSKDPIDANAFRRGGVNVCPLYLYSKLNDKDQEKQKELFSSENSFAKDSLGRVPNLNPAFIRAMAEKLDMRFVGDLTPGPSPERRGVGGEVGAGAGGRDGQEEAVRPALNLPEASPDLAARMLELAREKRRSPTRAEAALWEALRSRKLGGFKFRRQHIFHRCIVDFYCPEARLVVEVDGDSHDGREEEDRARQAYLEEMGLRVSRFRNEEVLNDVRGVLDALEKVLLEGKRGAKSVREGSRPGVGYRTETFTPEDVFHYIYAIFHSPTYRERYAEFLKIDFPRVPLTSDAALFRELCVLGQELVALHLLESPAVSHLFTHFPVPGENRVEKGYPNYNETAQRVYINKDQYFEGVPPEVWHFCVGGYQVSQKWLKDRRGRVLGYDELNHYQKVLVALRETMCRMEEIDLAIDDWPLD